MTAAYPASTIRRGRMRADHFTQVSNALARDRRLSRRARGLFLELASHREGWQTSIAALTEGGPEGIHALRAAIGELETHGYLVRAQARDQETGRVSGTEYWITDCPEAHQPKSDPSCENLTTDSEPRSPSSEPSCDFPSTGEPSTGEPSAENRTHKKNISKKTNYKKTKEKKNISLSAREVSASMPPGSDSEREKEDPLKPKLSMAERVVRQANELAEDEVRPFIAWAERTHQVRGGGWWKTVAENGTDLRNLMAEWYADRYPARPSGPRPYDRPLDEVLAAPDGVSRVRDEDTTLRGASAAREALQTLRRPARAGGPPDPSVYYEEM